MLTELDEGPVARRRLILRDSLAILSLTLITAVLFAVTLFLFRSFSAHRVDLAQRWAERGKAALGAGKPDEAVTALRTALTYSQEGAAGTRESDLLLAEALGETGRPAESEESYQYFMSLWGAEPGNGTINLELARLARKRNDKQSAVNFYRAAVYGTWEEGDGVVRRAAVRLELAQYLIAGGDLAAARLELLIAGGNAPDDYGRDMEIGGLLEQAQDAGDAAVYYQRAAAAQPGNADAPAAAGRLAYKVGDYENARRLLAKAQAERAAKPPASAESGKKETPSAGEQAQSTQDAAMLEDATRILELMPSSTLPAKERVARILTARAIAKQRFASCTAQLTSDGGVPPAMAALGPRWAGQDGTANAPELLRDSDGQASAMRLVYDTETESEKVCSAARGDDALLLRLASPPGAGANQDQGGQAQTNVPRD